MRLTKRLTDWNAASAAFERERDAQLPDARPGGASLTGVGVLITVLRVLAVAAVVAGTLCGIDIGRSVVGWNRYLGLAAPGWAVVVAGAVGAAVLVALAAVLARFDRVDRRARS